MTVDRPHRGASAKAAPYRAGALRARRADAWRLSPLPVGRWWPAVTHRPAPASRGKQRLTGRGLHCGIEPSLEDAVISMAYRFLRAEAWAPLESSLFR